MREKISWMRQYDRMHIARVDRAFGKPVLGMDDLGFEKVVDYPAYDNGSYVVIDTVKDVQWAVLWKKDYGFITMRDDFLNRYEAMEYADDLKESDGRHEEI